MNKMTNDIPQILSNMRIAYEYEMGEYLEPKSRLRTKVELRNALVNAARPYGTMTQLAEMIGKSDHSTICHSVKEHDSYHNFSPQYRRNYSVALKVVEKFAGRHHLLPRINNQHGGATTIEFELDSLNRSIEAMQNRRDRLLEKLQDRRSSSIFDNQQTI